MPTIEPAPESIAPPGTTTGLGSLTSWATALLCLYWPLLAIGTHWPNLQLPQAPPHPLASVLQIDKFAHAIGFTGLTALVLFSSLSGRRRAWAQRCLNAFAICMAYALADELSQGLMSGRVVSFADMVTNATAVLGVYLVARQPRVQQRRWPPKLVLAVITLVTPAVIYSLLSPWVMTELYDLKRSLIEPSKVNLGRLDYWVHAVLSLLIASVALAIVPAASRRPRWATFCALLFLALSGPVIEVLQFYTGRGVQALDVLFHSTGVLIAMAGWALWPMRQQADTMGLDSKQGAAITEHQGSPSFVGHAVLVSALTLLSRFAGLARDAVLAAALGLSVVADAFFIGFLVPNLFRRLFGEGALTAAFIPNYTELLERDPALAKRFATLTLTLLSALLVGITILGELALWWIANNVEVQDKTSWAIFYTQLMLPYMPLICAVALIGGILQVHKRFGPPAAAPLVLNGVIVVVVLMATSFFTESTGAKRVAMLVSLGIVFAGVVQLYWQITELLKVTGLSRSFKGCWPTMRSMLLMMGPMVLGLAVFQINSLLDALIAFFFAPGSGAEQGDLITMFGQTFDAPLRNGDVAALNWSQRLYQFPLGVFGIAIATAIFPALSAAAARLVPDRDELDKPAKPLAVSGEFADIVRQGLRLTAFIAVPASAGLILVRVPLARTVFEHGSFTTDDALRVSIILAGYAFSVWAYSMTHTLTRAFYALKDAKTPLIISAAMVALNLTLNLSLIWSLGAAGLAWSTAISAAGQVALLVLLLRKRVDKPIDAGVINSWARTMVATTVMAGVLFVVTLRIDPLTLSWRGSAGLLAAMVAVGMAVFFIMAKLTKAEELGWLHRRSIK